MHAVKKWLIIARGWTFVLDFVPVTVGALLALPSFNPAFYLLMLVGVISLNAFANIANDIYDFEKGVDKPEDRAISKRIHPILSKTASVSYFKKILIVLGIVSALCGAYIALFRGVFVIVTGVIGLAVAYIYTAGHRSLKSTGLGEPAVLLVFGPLIVGSAYFVESGSISLDVALISLVVGIPIMLVLLSNNIRDIEPDKKSGMRTISVRLGKTRSADLFTFFLLFNYLLLFLLAAAGILPVYSLISLLSLPYAIKINRFMHGKIPPDSAALTSRFVLVFGVLLSLGILAGKLLG